MSEPQPEYTTSSSTPGVEWVDSDMRVIDVATLEKLRPNLIAALRYVDLVLYGRDDKTIPKRRR